MNPEHVYQWVGVGSNIAWIIVGLALAIYKKIGEVRRDEWYQWDQVERGTYRPPGRNESHQHTKDRGLEHDKKSPS